MRSELKTALQLVKGKPAGQPTTPLQRTIQTTYMHQDQVVKINKAAHANSAVLRCVDHMQLNHYQASVAEVYDTENGVLHAVITHGRTGKITIVYKREVKEGM